MARHVLGDSRRGNGDEPSSGVSGWRNWSTSIPRSYNPVGIPGGGWSKARPWGFPEGKRRSPTTSGVSMHIMGHRPHHFPLPNVNDVVPYSPGLCGSPHYPGSWPHRVPYPARGCAVRARRWCDKQRRNGIGFLRMDGVSVAKRLPGIMITPSRIVTPIRSFGTTHFGVVA